MSPALPQVSGKETVKALEAAGFEHRSTKGSPAKLRHPDGRVVIVPLHLLASGSAPLPEPGSAPATDRL